MFLLNQRNAIRLYLGIIILCCGVLAWQLFWQAQALDILGSSLRWQAAIIFSGAVSLFFAVLFGATWQQKVKRWITRPLTFPDSRIVWRILAVLYLAGVVILLTWIFVGPYGQFFSDLAGRLALFGLGMVGGGVLLKAVLPEQSFYETLLFSALALAAGLRAGLFVPEVTTYPFSLGWSETSRYFYASLWLPERLFGLDVPPPVMHPSRYLLQSLPYLIADSSLWLHRLWQVLLWVGLPLLTVVLLARRYTIPKRWQFWVFVLWSFLFIYQGPIYYHLTICLILVLVGYDGQRFGRTLLFVILAAVWAGISRVNWIPVPGALAAVFFLLEHRLGRQTIWNYLWRPAAWFILGGVSGIVSQSLYAFWSGNDPTLFSTSFTSDLLWYRLLPNPTFPTGILPTALFFSLPMILMVGRYLWPNRVHYIRLLGLLSVLLVFFAGGLVVSVKIGGGNNLHNLDVYFFILMVIVSNFYWGKVEYDHLPQKTPTRPHSALLTAVLLLPIVLVLQSGGPIAMAAPDRVEKGVDTIRDYVRQAEQSGGEILFIAEKHLQIFGPFQDVPFNPDYERTFLMEMAMARSLPYLEQFYTELKNHRFALIISQPLNLQMKGAAEPFGEENDAWVEYVARYILCYYEPVETMRDVNLQFLVPRQSTGACP
jgi:hypothetical protein